MDISEIISKEDLLRINEGFGGNLRSDSSIDFAFERVKDSRIGPYKKLSYLLRAILVDHPFLDGNKRTATFVCLAFADKCGKEVDRELLIHHIISIANKNIQEIRNIEWRLKNAIK
jgi:prophage maintenance system killer protein